MNKPIVRLLAHERIVARGTERTTWWVYIDEQWLPVRNHPEVVLEQLNAGPQVVWETAAELPLELGTWLLRVRYSPLHAPPRDPLGYLDREELRARQKEERSYFRVGPRGTLSAARGVEPPPLLPTT
ncbi:MAG TPA: hypothetical protein VHM70_02730 [Polyangiaceae bacterium]|jgi:hypothetical protein|nr:hypothetical protein [Polyangiaceae bacterium]